MSNFHCECGFAADNTESFADHLGWVFDPDDDIGNDGITHAETSHDRTGMHQCTCGFTAGPAEFNDHLLIVVIPLDAIGLDGKRHAPLSTTTPDRWYVRPATGQ